MTDKTLDQYLSTLMSDDDELNKFLADPTNGGAEHGITKAERSVLRRTVAHLSNNSKNGYSVQRELGSYRRSIRLLQNVLHTHGGNHAVGAASVDVSDSSATLISFHVYFTGDPNMPGAPVDNPGLAYTDYATFTLPTTGNTLGDAMHFNPAAGDTTYLSPVIPVSYTSGGGTKPSTLQYKAILMNDNWYVEAFIVGGEEYELHYVKPTEDTHDAFWFYSFGGKAIKDTNGHYEVNAPHGTSAQGFNEASLGDDTVVFWQAIAPDQRYGFGKCF